MVMIIAACCSSAAARLPSVGSDDKGQLFLNDNSSSITLADLLGRLSAAESRLSVQDSIMAAQQSTMTTLLQQVVFDATCAASVGLNTTLVQRFGYPTGLVGIHYFRIAITAGATGDYDHYLALGDGSGDTAPYILKFDINLKQFVLFQILDKLSVYDFDSFQMNGFTYLLVVSASNPTGTSNLMRFNGTRFVLAQQFPSQAAPSGKYFSITGSDHNIVIASGVNSGVTNIYRYNASTSTFVSWKTISNSIGLQDVEVFAIGGATYLAMSSDNTGATIYLYNPATDNFAVAQTFTDRATTVKFSSFNGLSFLVLNLRFSGTAQIYKWNSTIAQFQLLQSVAATCTYQSAFFQNRQDQFLALSLEYVGTCFASSTIANSLILRYNGTLFVPATTFQTRGGCQIAPFTIQGTTYIAASGAESETDGTTGRLFQLTKVC